MNVQILNMVVSIVIIVACSIIAIRLGKSVFDEVHEHHGWETFEVKTGIINDGEHFRWSQEILYMLISGKKPWYRGFRVETHRKDIWLFWKKSEIIDTRLDYIEGSDFVMEPWNSYSKQDLELLVMLDTGVNPYLYPPADFIYI